MYKKLIYNSQRLSNILKAYTLFFRSRSNKECYFGPFVGEFGHLLSHVVPFIAYLYSKGVKVHYCGPLIHKPFFRDDKGNLIVETYYGLRDFYSEIQPMMNEQIYPDDVADDINKFITKAQLSKEPFWDIRSSEFYWDVFCKWEYLNRYVKVYSFKNEYLNIKENSVVIFARKKGNYSSVRGDDWNFQELVDYVKQLAKKVYVVGHPAFSHSISGGNNVEVILTNDNSIIIDKCLRADFIINQLSGTHYLGLYCNTKVILLLKGYVDYSNVIKDSKYRNKLGAKYEWEFAHSLEDIKRIILKDKL